jgi:hypothetical protein
VPLDVPGLTSIDPPTSVMHPVSGNLIGTMKIIQAYSFILLLFLFSCNSNRTKNPNSLLRSQLPDTSTTFTIYEDSLENITLNEVSVSVATLENRLKQLKAKDGLVIYDCRGKTNCPPSHSLVIDLIRKHGFSLNLLLENQFHNVPNK